MPSLHVANLKPFDGNGLNYWEFWIRIRLDKENCIEALYPKPVAMSDDVIKKIDI